MTPMTLPSAVDERSAGVAGLDGRVGLDEAGQLLGRAVRRVLRGDRLVERGDACRSTTLGCPPRPPALPTPTTSSPTATLEESPSGATVSPEALTSLMTAMSWLAS